MNEPHPLWTSRYRLLPDIIMITFSISLCAKTLLLALMAFTHLAKAWPLLGLSGSLDGTFHLAVLNNTNCTFSTEANSTVYSSTAYKANRNLLELAVDTIRGCIYVTAWDNAGNVPVVLELLNPAAKSRRNASDDSSNLTLTLQRVFSLPLAWEDVSIQLDPRQDRLLVAGMGTMIGDDAESIRVGAVSLRDGHFTDLAMLPGTAATNGPCAAFDESNRILVVPTYQITPVNMSDYFLFYYNWLNVDTLQSGRFSEPVYFSQSLIFSASTVMGMFWRLNNGHYPDTNTNISWAMFSSETGAVAVQRQLLPAAQFPVSLVLSHTLDLTVSGPIYWALVKHPQVDPQDFPWTKLASVSTVTGEVHWSSCLWRLEFGPVWPDAIVAWPWS